MLLTPSTPVYLVCLMDLKSLFWHSGDYHEYLYLSLISCRFLHGFWLEFCELLAICLFHRTLLLWLQKLSFSWILPHSTSVQSWMNKRRLHSDRINIRQEGREFKIGCSVYGVSRHNFSTVVAFWWNTSQAKTQSWFKAFYSPTGIGARRHQTLQTTHYLSSIF